MALKKIMYPGQVNSRETITTSALNATDTSLTVLDGGLLPDAPNLLVLGAGSTAETVLMTAKDGNVLTLQRGFQGVPKTWALGTVIARNYTEYDYAAMLENITDVEGRLEVTDNKVADNTSAIGQRVNKAGDEMTGHLTIPSFGTSKFKMKSFFLNMATPQGNNEVEIDLGVANFGGTLKVSVSSTWNTGNASGSVEKVIDFMGNNAIAWQRSKYAYVAYVMNSCFMISDIYIKNGRKTIKIVRNAANTGVDISILLEGFGQFDGLENATLGIPVVSTGTFIPPSMTPTETVITSGFASGWSGMVTHRKNQEEQKTLFINLVNNIALANGQVPYTLDASMRPIRIVNFTIPCLDVNGIPIDAYAQCWISTSGNIIVSRVTGTQASSARTLYSTHLTYY